jgi:small-conductance mechanosensitive channel
MTGAVDAINQWAGPILVVLVVALVAYLGVRFVGRAVTPFVLERLRSTGDDHLTRSLNDAETRKRLTTVSALVDWLFRVLIIATAVFAILAVLNLTAVMVAILVLVAVVGVVARDVIRDYVGGVLIVLENQFAIGDWVKVGSVEGEVEALSLRRTTLRSMGGDLVTVPNGDIRTITNATRTWARINLEIGIVDPARVDAARTAIDEAGQSLRDDPVLGPSVLDPPRFMRILDIGEDGIRLLIWGRVRAADRWALEGEYRKRLLEALGKAGIELVTSQRIQLVGRAADAPTADPPGDVRNGEQAARPAPTRGI